MSRARRSSFSADQFNGRALVTVAAAAVVATIVLHVVVALVTVYGIHRDEFLYMSMGRHLQLWRMDFPPFIALAAQAELALTGGTLWLRLLPALAHASIVACAVVAVRVLGGATGAQIVAAIGVILPPIFMRPGSLLQPVVFDQLWWTIALVALMLAAKHQSPRWWLAIGAALGLGLLTKFSVVFIGTAIAIATLLSPLRRHLLTPWPWLAFVITIGIGAPSIAGQVALDWPLPEQMADLQSTQLARMTWLQFIVEQPMMLGGIAFVVALVGLVWLFTSSEVKWARVVASATVVAFLLVMFGNGKAYYIGPVYPVLIAAGAAATERIWSNSGRRRTQMVMAATLLISGIALFPVGAPILAPPHMARYAQALGMGTFTQTNMGVVMELPQDYADMLGWRRLADTVAHVYRALPDAERAHTVIVAENYGRAGALEYYRATHGLPEVVSPAGSFWFFGPGKSIARTIIVAGDQPEDVAKFCGEVTRAARIEDPILVPEERVVDIHICRKPHATLQEAWGQFR